MNIENMLKTLKRARADYRATENHQTADAIAGAIDILRGRLEYTVAIEMDGATETRYARIGPVRTSLEAARDDLGILPSAGKHVVVRIGPTAWTEVGDDD